MSKRLTSCLIIPCSSPTTVPFFSNRFYIKIKQNKYLGEGSKKSSEHFFYTRDFHNIKIIWVIPRTSSVRQKRFFDGFSAWILNSC